MPESEDTPIACTIRPGKDEEALLELYRTLFADAYLDRRRTASGVRWTFRAGEGVEVRVRALAAMEQECCAFLRMRILVADGEVRWDVTGPEAARELLDKYFRLPETMSASIERLRAGASSKGLRFEPAG
jgi:hypothetical protein